jgi:hypothetical protein
MAMKPSINPDGAYSFHLEMTKVFYGSFVFSLATTLLTTILIFTSDFLAHHGLLHLLLQMAGFALAICAITSGITVLLKSGRGEKAIHGMVLFVSFLHILFLGYILITLISYNL